MNNRGAGSRKRCGESLAQQGNFHNGWVQPPSRIPGRFREYIWPTTRYGIRPAGCCRSDFFDLNDGLALIGPAIQAGVVWKLEFVTLGTHRHTRRGDPQFLCATLVASGSRMLMFRIRHGSSSNSRSSEPLGPPRPTHHVFVVRMTLIAVGGASAGH